MRLAASCVRLVVEVAGVFLMLAVTSSQFGAPEMVALLGIAFVLIAVEAAVALSTWTRPPQLPVLAGVALAASLIGLGWLGCASHPHFKPGRDLVALIEEIRR